MLGIISSCYQYDPIDAKERLIEELKNKNGKLPSPDPENPQPENPSEEPIPEPSEDGKEFTKIHFSFDSWKKKPDMPYYIPVNSEKEKASNTYWVSASNRGYTNFSSDLQLFPVLELKEGYKNSGVQLISRPPVGPKAAFAPQLLAGSLYSGLVVGGLMNQNPTRFGKAWRLEPIKLSFYYKYKAGDTPINGLQGQDVGAVNVVLYDITYDKTYLDKTSVKNDSRIVLKAYSHLAEQAEWKEITLEFKQQNKNLYKSLDFKKREYRLAIIFSSSARGNEFVGALGSTLCIDELSVVCKNEAKENGNNQNDENPNNQLEQTHFSFDQWKKVPNSKGNYYTPVLTEDEDPKKSYWASESNFIFDTEGGSYTYPVQKLENGKQGSGVKLISRSNYPHLPYYLIAGELYNGYVNPTRIGRNWEKGEPTCLKFHYKYKAGKSTIYGDLQGNDKGAVRALLYEVTDDETYYLNKAELKKEDNERIILEAYQEFGNQDWGSEMILDFNVKNEARYKSLDFKNKKYRLAILFTSSYKSLEGKGVWDSTLQIDELTIYSKKK